MAAMEIAIFHICAILNDKPDVTAEIIEYLKPCCTVQTKLMIRGLTNIAQMCGPGYLVS